LLIVRHYFLSILLFFIPFVAVTLQAQNNALWVWNTRQIIDQPAYRDTLLAVTDHFRIRTLFLFFPYSISSDGDTIALYQRDSLISLLRWAKEHALSVHALAGEPEWALPAYHNRPVAFAREVLALRRETGLPDGIQFDIEPYLLLPFSLPKTKQKLLSDWIHSVWATGKVVRQDQGLSYGIAIPFWMEDTIAVDGKRMPVGKHLSYLTDYLAVMAYRNTAEGSAGVISFSEQERQWSKDAGRSLFIGIETLRLGGSTTTYLCETDAEMFSQMVSLSQTGASGFMVNGAKISVETIDGRAVLGVGGSTWSDRELEGMRRALMQRFNGAAVTMPLHRLVDRVRESEKIASVDLLPMPEGNTAIRIVTQELKQSTMFNLSPAEFARQYSILQRYTAQFPEIVGIAIHDFNAVRKFLPLK
jgi:hypothetical protein